MAHSGSTSLPRTAVVPIAIAAARRAKLIAIVSAVLCGIFLIAGVADMVDSSRRAHRDDAATIIVVGVCGVISALAVGRAMRITAAARRAAADVGSTWTLTGKLVVAADDHGFPVPEHSFKITRAQSVQLSPESKLS